MARTCDSCNNLINQKDDEYLELSVRVLLTNEDTNQDSKVQSYRDFCDKCIKDGKALKKLLEDVNWML